MSLRIQSSYLKFDAYLINRTPKHQTHNPENPGSDKKKQFNLCDELYAKNLKLNNSVLVPEAFNCHLKFLSEGFLTPNSAAVYLKSGLETPPTNVNLNN